MMRRRPQHQHLMYALERHDARLDTDDRIGIGGARFRRDSLQGEVARLVEDL